MLKGLLDHYRERIKPHQKRAFISTFILGLIIHLYKFTNLLPVVDSIKSVYSAENVIGSGRWFLSTACAISSFYDLPWINGLLSVFYIALTAAVVADIFNITDPVCNVLAGGLLVSFPAVTETMYYGYTSDGYMLAMLLAGAVRLSLPGEKKPRNYAAAGILLCLSCAIYQSYVCFALMLWLAFLIVSLLSRGHTRAQYLDWAKRTAVVLVGGLALYFVVWKLLMAIENAGVNNYLGIDRVGQISPRSLLVAAYSSYRNIFFYFTDIRNVLTYGPSAMAVFHMIFALFFAAAVTVSVIRSGILRSRGRLAALIAAFIITPFAVYMWLFSSPGVGYGPRMEQSICVYLILFAVLAEKWLPLRPRNAAALLLAAGIFIYSIGANICYFYLQSCYEYSYASAVELATRIHMVDDGSCDTILIGGHMPVRTGTADVYEEKALKTVGPYHVHIFQILYNKPYHIAKFFQYYTGTRMVVQYDGEYHETVRTDKDGKWEYITSHIVDLDEDDSYSYIFRTDRYIQMNCWPEDGCIQVIDGVIVVKLSNRDYTAEPLEEDTASAP